MKRRRLSENARLLLLDSVENMHRTGPCAGRGGVTYTANEYAVRELRARGLLWVIEPRHCVGGFANEDFSITVIPSPRGERVARTIPPMSRGERLFKAAEENQW